MLLFSTILLLNGSVPLKAIVFVLLVEIFSPYLEVTVSSLCTEISGASSESAAISWSSVEKKCLNVLIFF